MLSCVSQHLEIAPGLSLFYIIYIYTHTPDSLIFALKLFRLYYFLSLIDRHMNSKQKFNKETKCIKFESVIRSCYNLRVAKEMKLVCLHHTEKKFKIQASKRNSTLICPKNRKLSLVEIRCLLLV